MHRDQKIVVHPLPHRFVSWYVRIALVRPIDEQRFTDNFIPTDEPPIPTIIAVVAIVAHDEVVVWGDNHGAIVVPYFQFFWSPRVGSVRCRIHVNFIRLIEFCTVDQDVFIPNFDSIARQPNNALYEWDVSICRRFECDDIQPLYGSMGQVTTKSGWIIRRKRNFVQEEVVADQNRRFHRFSWNLCRLRHIAGENQNENDRKREALNPFAECSFVSGWKTIEKHQLV